ncbi:MAG: hypothetical protein ACRDNL_01720 [Spirillospora sp.]
MTDTGDGRTPPDGAGNKSAGNKSAGNKGTGGKANSGGGKWADQVLPALIVGVCAGIIVSVATRHLYAFAWLRTLVTGAATLIGIVALAWLVTRKPVKKFVKNVFARLPQRMEPVLWAVAGAALVGVVLLSAVGIQALLERTGSCEQPLELRVLTTPEALTPLRAAAAEFENDGEERGCRRYSVTIVPQAGPVPLYDGFGLLWRRSAPTDGRHAEGERLLGPQPDIWIPSSMAEYAFVPKGPGQGAGQVAGRAGAPAGPTGAPETGDPIFTPRGSLGTSPLVLALFGEAHRRVADPSEGPVAPSTAGLLKDMAAAGVPVRKIARPVPETSAAALAVTPALYDALPGRDPEDERTAEPAGPVAPDAVSLLCRFRQLAANPNNAPPAGTAVAVPEQVLHDYDMGRPLGDRCGPADPAAAPYAKWRLYPHYAKDLPTLDHPFIQVRWRGQDTEERNAAVTGFRRWLDGHPLTLQGFRDGRGSVPATREGDTRHFYLSRLQSVVGGRVVPPAIGTAPPKGVQETLHRIGDARPKISVSLMLDVSGSMGGPVPGREGSRLDRGTSFLRSLVSQLHGSDGVGLQVASRLAPPGNPGSFGNVPPDSASAEHKNAITSRLQAIAADGPDLPLGEAIGAADPGPGRANLVLVTDGQGPTTNRRIGARAARLSGEFRDRHPDLRVTIVLTGPARCDSAPVRQIVAALRGGAGAGCEELDGASEVEQAAGLLSGLR